MNHHELAPLPAMEPEMQQPVDTPASYMLARLRGDEGFLALAGLPSLKVAAGGLIVALTAVAGVAGFIDGHVGVKNELTVTAGTGTIKEVFTLPPNECHGGYITGASAEARYNKSLNIGPTNIPTTLNWLEGESADISNVVCNTMNATGTREIDLKNHKVTISIPASAFNTIVSLTDPTKVIYHSDNGFLAAEIKNLENVIKVIPKLDSNYSDDMQGRLRGVAELAMYSVSTEACGQKAWNHLKLPYAAELQKNEIANAQAYSTDGYQWKSSDITVNLPDKVALKNQYDKQLSALEDVLQKNGVTVSMPNPNDLVCTDTTDGKVANTADNAARGQS